MENLLSTFVNMVITGTFAIIAVMAVRLLLKPAPRIFSYLLWIAVLVRLTCPVLPQSDYFGVVFHWEDFSKKMEASSEKSDGLPTERIAVTSEEEDGAGTPAAGGRKETADHSFDPAQPETAAKAGAGTGEREALLLKALFAVWFTVLAGILCYEMSSYLFFMRRIGRSEIRERIEDRKFTVKISGAVKTPFTSGFLRPVIYLPENMEIGQEKLVIEHEKMHIKRFDYLVKPFAFFVCCIYWFHPLVWAAFYLMEQDMETSCDEAVLRKIGFDRKKDYASTLLFMAGEQKWKAGYPIAFGENSVKSRIRHAVKVKKPSKWTIALSAVLVIIIVGMLSVNRAEAGKAPEEQWRAPDNNNEVTEHDYYGAAPGADSGKEMESTYIPVMEQGDVGTITNFDPERDQFEVLLLTDTGVHNDLEIRYSYPVVYSGISDVFGTRVHPVTQEELLHSGVDFAAERGTPITAAADGTVAETGFDAECGNYIILQHSNGDFTYYACCEEILAGEGSAVKRRQRIATVGSTGKSTGAHLHFALSRNGEYVDPMPLMEAEETESKLSAIEERSESYVAAEEGGSASESYAVVEEGGSISESTRAAVQEVTEKYGQFGLTGEVWEDEWQLYYNGEPVCFFADNRNIENPEVFKGEVISEEANAKNGYQGVVTVRNGEGEVTGLLLLSGEEAKDYRGENW